MSRRFLFRLLAAATLAAAPSLSLSTAAPPNAEAYIIWPHDGTVISGGKFWVRMGLRNMGVCPKGVESPRCGHHHLLVDTELPPLDKEILRTRTTCTSGRARPTRALSCRPASTRCSC